MKIGEGAFSECSITDIESIIPVQAYSQKQLSSVGTRVEELERFIFTPIQKQIATLNNDIAQIRENIKFCYSKMQIKRNIEKEIQVLKKEGESTKLQEKELSSTIKNLTDNQKALISLAPQYDKLNRVIESWERNLETLKESIDGLISLATSYRIADNSDLDDTLKKHYESISAHYNQIYQNLAEQLTGMKSNIGGKHQDVFLHLNEWRSEYSAIKEQYDTINNDLAANATLLSTLKTLSTRTGEIEQQLAQRCDEVKKYDGLLQEYQLLQSTWITKHNEKNALINKQCQILSSLSDGYIEAHISTHMDLEKCKVSLKKLFEGSRISEAKTQGILDYIQKSSDSMDVWMALLSELEILANHDNIENNADQIDTPNLSKIGLVGNDKNRIATKLTTEAWIDIATQEFVFSPVFNYVTNKGTKEFISFKDASAGQQATALITVLLNQDGMPLLIDQPEDDIDNKSIERIVESIWKAKQKRQIIFTSHNANLVVNGDAELILCCDYRKTGDQSGGHIKLQGAIDEQPIKNEITDIMEGGEKAFRLRKEKYGF